MCEERLNSVLGIHNKLLANYHMIYRDHKLSPSEKGLKLQLEVSDAFAATL